MLGRVREQRSPAREGFAVDARPRFRRSAADRRRHPSSPGRGRRRAAPLSQTRKPGNGRSTRRQTSRQHHRQQRHRDHGDSDGHARAHHGPRGAASVRSSATRRSRARATFRSLPVHCRHRANVARSESSLASAAARLIDRRSERGALCARDAALRGLAARLLLSGAAALRAARTRLARAHRVRHRRGGRGGMVHVARADRRRARQLLRSSARVRGRARRSRSTDSSAAWRSRSSQRWRVIRRAAARSCCPGASARRSRSVKLARSHLFSGLPWLLLAHALAPAPASRATRQLDRRDRCRIHARHRERRVRGARVARRSPCRRSVSRVAGVRDRRRGSLRTRVRDGRPRIDRARGARHRIANRRDPRRARPTRNAARVRCATRRALWHDSISSSP